MRLREKLGVRDANVRRYYPDVLANAKEMKILAGVVEPELDLAIGRLKQHALNTFVFDFDDKGLERWEQMLSIVPRAGANKEERRREILIRINASLPYTERQLQKLIDATFGGGNVTASTDHNEYTVWLDLAVHANIDTWALSRYVRQVVPANMGINLRTAQESNSALYFGGRVAEYSEQRIGG